MLHLVTSKYKTLFYLFVTYDFIFFLFVFMLGGDGILLEIQAISVKETQDTFSNILEINERNIYF